jgi:energy-coupling factor transporter ATP-binding protein EcfA2
MKQALLESLEVRRFRTFQHLQIERLGRVNLIVGKNNVGKTCLLEALWFYGHRVSPGLLVAMQKLLQMRGETGLSEDTENQSVRHFFYGRQDLREQLEPIQVGSVSSPKDLLSINVIWFTEQTDQDGVRRLQFLPSDANDTVNVVPGLGIQVGEETVLRYPLDRDIGNLRRVTFSGKFKQAPCIFVPANGLNGGDVSQFWDKIALTDLEQGVLDSLRIITSGIERVNLLSGSPMVKIKGSDSPLPLRSLGEGLNRLFGIVLALVNAQDGILLVDEVDSGLHYSIQPDMWRLIFQVARRLNVQVFATTHSWDCVEAFQEAAKEHGQSEGMLVSLRRKKGAEDQVVAILFDERELEIVTRERIEVR